jgi:hypothetical protein
MCQATIGDEGPSPGRRRPATMVPSAMSSTPTTARQSLCIGMATHGEFDGVWFTIQALRMYHGRAADDVSFIVIDNDPGAATGAALRAIGDWIPRYRYVAFGGYTGTAVRDLVFRESEADVVCCMDSHVLLGAGALQALRDWFDAHPDTLDLLQGQLLHDDLAVSGALTHFEPTWGAGMFGQWARDPRLDDPGDEPFEIEMQGLGLFACRRSAWPGLNPRLRGFGSEEGYLHEKFRRRGGHVLCHPRLTWTHRFSRPLGISYPNRWEDRMRNYLVAWGELGWDVAPMEAHFLEQLGSQFDVPAVLDRAHEEVDHGLGAFDAVLCLADDDGAGCTEHRHPLPIAWRSERIQLDAGLAGEHRRLAGWHRALTTASARGYRHVLVLEDQSGPDAVTDPSDGEAPWDLCLLTSTEAGTNGSLQSVGRLALAGLTVAVHSRAFDRILADMGDDDAGREAFLGAWPDLETYLLDAMASGAFTAIGEAFADPAVDVPVHDPDLALAELAGGLVVRVEAGSHELNNTASIVLTFCDGERRSLRSPTRWRRASSWRRPHSPRCQRAWRDCAAPGS